MNLWNQNQKGSNQMEMTLDKALRIILEAADEGDRKAQGILQDIYDTGKRNNVETGLYLDVKYGKNGRTTV